MILTELQLRKLNAYVGCGPHMDTDILVMGDEEGTGGYPKEIEAHCTARSRLYGKDDKTVDKLLHMMQDDPKVLHNDRLFLNEEYVRSNNGSWVDGFWEDNDTDGGSKIERYIIARDGAIKKKVTQSKPNSPFLNYISRLCLALNHRDENIPIEHWFREKQDMSEVASEFIDNYTINQLFKKDSSGVRTALTDWGPLPRPNVKSWFEEYSLLGNKKDSYEKAFKFHDSERGTLAYELASRRAELLGDLISRSKARFLLMVGKVERNLMLLKRFFPNHNIQEKVMPLQTRNSGYTVTLKLPQEGVESKQLHVYIMPFFGNGALSLWELSQFYRHVLLPDFLEQPRTEWEKREIESKDENSYSGGSGENSGETGGGIPITTPDPGVSVDKLELTVSQIISMAPELNRNPGIRTDKKIQLRYIHFWYDEGHWEHDRFCAHLHEKRDGMLEIRLGIYYGKYEGADREKLETLATRAAESSWAAQYDLDWGNRNRPPRLIIKKNFEWTDRQNENDATEELLMLMRRVKEIYDEI